MTKLYRLCPKKKMEADKKAKRQAIDELLIEANRVVDLGLNATNEQRKEAKAKEREILERIAKIDPEMGERLIPKSST
jgi:hypothetical protein